MWGAQDRAAGKGGKSGKSGKGKAARVAVDPSDDAEDLEGEDADEDDEEEGKDAGGEDQDDLDEGKDAPRRRNVKEDDDEQEDDEDDEEGEDEDDEDDEPAPRRSKRISQLEDEIEALRADLRKSRRPAADRDGDGADEREASETDRQDAPKSLKGRIGEMLKTAAKTHDPELVNKVIKPIVDALADEVGSLKQVEQYVAQMRKQEVSKRVNEVHSIIDKIAATGFVKTYGRSAADAAGNRKQRENRDRLYKMAAGIAATCEQNGVTWDTETVLNDAHEKLRKAKREEKARREKGTDQTRTMPAHNKSGGNMPSAARASILNSADMTKPSMNAARKVLRNFGAR